MEFYSPTVIVLLCWLACRWASRTDQLGTNPSRPHRPPDGVARSIAASATRSGGMQGEGHPKGYRFWRILSDASFGIYLVHVFILTALLQWVVPFMPEAWPVALRVFLTWFLTAGGATAISILLMKTPVLSHLVGRSAHWHWSKDAKALQEWFSNSFLAVCLSEARTQFVDRLHKIITFHRSREMERKESVR